ncbi:MAG: DUF983 domain-containing protein [Pseudomonadota bacterium]
MTIQLNTEPASVAKRDIGQAMLRGTLHHCPSCGEGNLYTSYLKIADACPNCHEELHHHRADDAPPYFTIFIVGHIIVGGILVLEKAMQPSALTHLLVWIPLTLILSLAMLPRIKGMLVGLQWALRMHGFGEAVSSGSDLNVDDATPVRQTAGH